MDPTACLLELFRLLSCTAAADRARRAELCRAFDGWLARGGFLPDLADERLTEAYSFVVRRRRAAVRFMDLHR